MPFTRRPGPSRAHFAAYRALGGLEGAIARRADEVVDALPAKIQDALPAIVRALTTVQLGDGTVATCPARYSDLAKAPAEGALVQALIGARLLVSDEDATGEPVVRVAHEALLSRWPRAREIVNCDREFLEARARVQTDARHWESEGCNPELLLPPGKRLAEAEELLARPQELSARVVAYVQASSSAQQAKLEKERLEERARIEREEAAKRDSLAIKAAAHRERLEYEAERQRLQAVAATTLARRTRMAAGIAVVLAIGAGIGAALGFRGQWEAVRQAERAEQNAAQAHLSETQARAAESQARAAETQSRAAEERAIAAREQALRNQSLSLALLSDQTASRGDTEAAILLALEALPTANAPDRPYVFEAEAALYKALLAHRQIRTFRHDGGVTDAKFSSDGKRIVTASYDGTARVWNVSDGTQSTVMRGHEAPLERATFSPDGKLVLTAARDRTARVWDATTGKQVFVFPQPGSFPTAIFNPQGTRILTAGAPAKPSLWDKASGAQLFTVENQISSAAFSPDGQVFLTGQNYDRTVATWSIQDGRPISRWFVQISPDEISLSPDGRRLLISSWDGIDGARLWDVAKGTMIAALEGHESDTLPASFSHDGRLVATTSVDGTARLWDGVTGKLQKVLGEDEAGLGRPNPPDEEMNSTFSRDNRLLATPSLADTVRVWDTLSGALLTTIDAHKSTVEHLAFSPIDNTLLTASHDGTARLWNLDGVLTTSLLHEFAPTFAVFRQGGRYVVTGGGDAVAHLWDIERATEVARFDTGEQVQMASFSPDGKEMATASTSGQISIWDVASGRSRAQFRSPEGGLVQCQFSQDGSVLETASVRGRRGCGTPRTARSCVN
jgi:WD40 repeat protein